MDKDPRLHFVAATVIVARKKSPRAFEYLIMKRSPGEKAFPGRWTVPGGKLVLTEYQNRPKTNADAWYNIIDWLLQKEVNEEAGIKIGKINYLTNLVFVRPDGFPALTLSYWSMYQSGKVKLGKDLVDFAWVTVTQAKKYDLISGIWEEIAEVNKNLLAP